LEEGSDAWKDVKQETDDCLTELRKITFPEPITVRKCESLVSGVAMGRRKVIDGRDMCMNVYDIRLFDDVPACGMNWPYDLPDVTTYLGRSDVKSALHATAHAESWQECVSRVSQELKNRDSPSSITLLPSLLERVPVMLYAGDQDFICNYMGIESLISSLEWGGQQGLGTVETKSWSVDGLPAGTWVESRNLTYVKVFNSSHMVPLDLPYVAHDMILRFMGVDFAAITEGSARIPSKLGDVEKPVPVMQDGQKDGGNGMIPVPPSKSPEQDKAMWEAYYNAGSAALVLVIIALGIGIFLYWRQRRRSRSRGASIGLKEESIPLSQSVGDEMNGHGDNMNGDYKGKGRALQAEAIFDVGSDEEGEYKDDVGRN